MGTINLRRGRLICYHLPSHTGPGPWHRLCSLRVPPRPIVATIPKERVTNTLTDPGGSTFFGDFFIRVPQQRVYLSIPISKIFLQFSFFPNNKNLIGVGPQEINFVLHQLHLKTIFFFFCHAFKLCLSTIFPHSITSFFL